jgi:Domain of unknown function (DUF1918)
MVQIGDRIEVESEKVGSATRCGVVTAIEGRLLTVRWDNGRESMFIPSAGSMRVLTKSPRREKVKGSGAA